MPSKPRTRSLTVVKSGKSGEASSTPKAPASLVAAVDLSERELLVAMRRKAASEIDAGAPAHAVPRLLTQLRELDREIRLLDARAAEERGAGGEVQDGDFDASAV